VLGRLKLNVLASVANALAVVASALVAVPLILDAVGTQGYGVWALGLAVVVYASMADAGLGPAIQRFTAVARGAQDRVAMAQLLWTTLLAYAAVGAVALLALRLAAGGLVDLFDLPAALRADAKEMFRLLGIAVAVALLAAGTGHLLAGLERFGALALSSIAGAIAFVVAIAVLAGDRGLPGLATALLLQQSVVAIVRLWAVRGLGLGHPVRPVGGRRLADMVRFSLPLQVSALADLLNAQSDKIVVGLVAALATVGQLGIGAQFADGGRLLATAALGPIVSTLAVTSGAGDLRVLQDHFARLHRLWVLGLLGAGVVGAMALRPLIEAWLGRGHDEAALLGGVLVLAATAGLATGSGAAYLRALGRPGLEARYGLLVVGVNVLLTIPLALAAGARGVVLGTLGAYIVGGLWFYSRLARQVPAVPFRNRREGAVAVGAALAAGAITLLVGSLAVAILPGLAALPVVAAGALAALAGYAAVVLGFRPPRRRLKRWIAGAPA
jgi:O-antigen/teichoic acid export membrane protein